MVMVLLDSKYDGDSQPYWDVDTDGTYLYVSGGDRILAYSFNGVSLSLEGSRADVTHFLWCHGGYIYATGDDGTLTAYTFDGADFTPAGTINEGTGNLWNKVHGDGTYIYVAAADDGIYAYTFDGANFTLKGTQDDDWMIYVFCYGGYIYAMSSSIIYAYTFDGTDFTLKDQYDITPESLVTCYHDGTYLYAVGTKLFAFTFDGTDFTLKGSVKPPDYALVGHWGVTAVYPYIYITDSGE